MSLEFYDEPLNLGLVTARDSAFIPKGALSRAQNARYRPGNYAIFPAEGRVKCGPSGGVDASGVDNQSIAPITQIVGLEWDEGTEGTPGLQGEYQQILFAEQSGQAGLYTLAASSDPEDVRLGRSYRRYLGVNSSTGRKPLQAVQFDNDWLVLSGSRGVVLQRKETEGTVVLPHGMDKAEPRIRAVPSYGANVFTAGSWWYWFVFVNSDGVIPIEGAADGWQLPLPLSAILPDGLGLSFVPPGFASNWFGVFPTNGTQNVQAIALYIPYDEWTDKRGVVYPGWLQRSAFVKKWADKIYVYRGRTAGQGAGPLSASLFNAWPIGYKIFEAKISDLEHPVANPLQDLDGLGQKWMKLGDDVFTYTADTVLSQPDMPTITLRIDGQEFPLARNGFPPRASVGTVFNESAVMNDEDDPAKSRFTFPQELHAVPDLFYINHRTGSFDVVQQYVHLGAVLGVYLLNGVERINFLPTATDFNFREGRLADDVLEMYGAVNSNAVAKFTHPSGRVMAAHVARNGIWVSDLFPEGTYEVTRNIDWRGLVGDPNNLSGAWLVNDPDYDRLVFGFNPNGGTPDRYLYLHYDITHLHPDRSFSITGPIERPGFAFASTLVTLESGTKQVVTTDINGRILYEVHGWADESESGGMTPMDVLTREIYVAGLTQASDTQVIGVHTTPSGSGGNTTIKLITTPRDVVKERKLAPGRQFALLNLGGLAEATQIQIFGDQATGLTGIGVNVLTYSWNPVGHAARRDAPVG